MTVPIAILIICSFLGGADYECNPTESFDSFEECEEVSRLTREAKGLQSYCVKLEDVHY